MVGLISQEPARSSPPAWSCRRTTRELTEIGDVFLAIGQPSVYSQRPTLNTPEPFVRGPGVRWNSAVSPRQPSRAIGFGK